MESSEILRCTTSGTLMNELERLPLIRLGKDHYKLFGTFTNGVVAYNTLPLELRTETNYGIFCKNSDLLLG